MNVTTTTLCHLNQDEGADIRCFDEEGHDYPVLTLGPVVFFPTGEQLEKIALAIRWYFADKIKCSPPDCDICRRPFDPTEGGQVTEHTAVCGECIKRLGELGDNQPAQEATCSP